MPRQRGSTVSDHDALEIKAGHSLQSSVMHLDHGGCRIHLIDTPGALDFIGQSLPALEAVETAAIVINAASPTALNGAVKEACDAGITVVSFDGVVTEPCAWRVAVDFKKMGANEIAYLEKRLPEGGNLLEIRGLAGVSVDDQIHAGIEEAVKANPKFKIVGSVNGDWAQDVAQKAVAGILPSLPEIAAVVTQGGDGYGAAQAFAAAGRPTPIIVMGNRQDELKWWGEQREKNGYETVSTSIAPGVSTLAFWVAQQILDGKDVPKDLTVPFLSVTPETLDQALKDTPEGGVTNVDYTLDDAQKVIAESK